jgi:hypothetical protein
MKKRCAVYCACQNEKFLILSLISSFELYKHNPYLDIFILTDITKYDEYEFKEIGVKLIILKNEIQAEIVDKKKITGFNVHGKFNNRKIKIQTFDYLPDTYDQIMFIDADILPLGDCLDIWDCLENKNDLAFALDITEKLGDWAYYNDTEEGKYTQKICPPNQPSYNSGVFVYNNIKVAQEFLRNWFKEWQKFGVLDQLALARTIIQNKFSIFKLDQKFNFCPSLIRDNKDFDKIVFLHLRKWIIPHTSLPSFFEKHASGGYEYMKKYYSKAVLDELISK